MLSLDPRVVVVLADAMRSVREMDLKGAVVFRTTVKTRGNSTSKLEVHIAGQTAALVYQTRRIIQRAKAKAKANRKLRVNTTTVKSCPTSYQSAATP